MTNTLPTRPSAPAPTRRPRRPPGPAEVFAPWARAQWEVDLRAHEPPPAPATLRTTGFLAPAAARRVAAWFGGPPTAPARAVHAAYAALERETAQLWAGVRDALGVRVSYVHGEDEPYADAAALCADLREHRTMRLRTIACEPPHPLLGGEEGGPVDQLRVVHDVLGHAALGVGFDLQSEYATWLQCRALFTPAAQGAAFCELVGAVTAYVVGGAKPALRADLPPAGLVGRTGHPTGDRPGRAGGGVPAG